MKRGQDPFSGKGAGVFLALLLAVGTTYAQDCPALDPLEQQAREAQCRAAGNEWSRFGARDALCNVYSCAERTKDGGKPCRDRADCEHLCVTDRPPVIGAEAPGRCTAVRTSFGCFTYVDGGRIVGRVCSE